MLQALFGFPDIAVRTMEVYTTGTLEAWLRPASDHCRSGASVWSASLPIARTAYRRVVDEEPRFPDYFHSATPEAEIDELNLGSRPARRASQGGVRGLRAIPWQFAWTQTRLMLGAWLGVEEAIDRAIERGEGDRLKAMYRAWPHFQSAIGLIEMVLAKPMAGSPRSTTRRLVPEPLRKIGVELRERLQHARARCARC
jgi:phosphoenolpyruvate carboxylase